jgi:hypothetical protein
MTWVATAVVSAAVIGAGTGIYASGEASSAQGKAAAQQAQTAKDTLASQQRIAEPYTTAGAFGVNELARQLGVAGDSSSAGYGSLNTPFEQTKFTEDPGYGFRLAEGQKALERSAAARGGLLSGSAMKGTLNYAQGLASQEYQNAFNRYTSQRDTRYNMLRGLTDVGAGAAGSMVGAAGAAGANTAAAQQARGEATASGYIGAANAVTGGLSNISSYYQNKPLNDMLANYYSPSNAALAPVVSTPMVKF